MSNVKEWIKRANRTMARIFNLDDTSFGNCDKCYSWCDCLEDGICQTCIKEEGETLQERADRTNPYILRKEGENK